MRQPLDAHAEGEAAHPLRVVAHRAEDVRVHHPRAQHLEPAGLLAHPAALAAAEEQEMSTSATGSVNGK